MHDASSAIEHPRRLTRLGKILLLVLLIYAVAHILPDVLRPADLHEPLANYLEGLPGARSAFLSWYPLGIVCFAADNSGKVTSVAHCDAGQDQLRVGDQIDLQATMMTYRRAAIEGGGYVAHDQPVKLMVWASGALKLVQLHPIREDLRFFGRKWRETWTLMLEQLAGLFFIGLAAFCVWQESTPVTWGFFLYSIYFNSGDVLVWYANLPAEALKWVGWSEDVFSGAGLAGLLMFALYFPDRSVSRQRLAGLWLLVAFVVLTGTSVRSFLNFTKGVPTENVYRVYYYLLLVTYVAVFALFLRTYITQPADRPRIRWVILGALTGLLCFIFAEVYTLTSLLDSLPAIPQWLLQMLFAANVLFPMAVAYAIQHHQVINIRLVINRSIAVVFAFVVSSLSLAFVELAFHHRVAHAPALAIIGAIIISLLHERLRGAVDIVNLLFYRNWLIAERNLRREAERLPEAAEVETINRSLIDLPAKDLNLTSAALFERRLDDNYHRIHATLSWPSLLFPEIPPIHRAIVASLEDHPTLLLLSDRDWRKPAPPPYPVRMPVLAVPIRINGS